MNMHVALAVFVGLVSVIIAINPKLGNYGLYLGIFGAALSSCLCKMAVDKWNSNFEKNVEQRRNYEDLFIQLAKESSISIRELDETILDNSKQLNLYFDSVYKVMQGTNLTVSEIKEQQQSVSAENKRILYESFSEIKQLSAKNTEVLMSSLKNMEEDIGYICEKVNDLKELIDENLINLSDSVVDIDNKCEKLGRSSCNIKRLLEDDVEKLEDTINGIKNNFETFIIKLDKQHKENQNLCHTISSQYAALSKEDNDILKRIQEEVFKK